MQCPELAPLASVPIVMVINPTALLLEQREGTFWTAGKSLACYNITISPLSRETPGGRNASLCEGFCHVASLSFIQPLEKKKESKTGLIHQEFENAWLLFHGKCKGGGWKQSKQSQISNILKYAEYNQDGSLQDSSIKSNTGVDLQRVISQTQFHSDMHYSVGQCSHRNLSKYNYIVSWKC